MDQAQYTANLALTIDALVGIAWIERVARCQDPRHPRRDELFPSDAERRQITETLVMADTLAAGGANTPREHANRARALTALARAIAIGAAVPGGIRFLSQHWWMDDDGTLQCRQEDPWKTPPKVWCVRHREGWCATRYGKAPLPAAGQRPHPLRGRRGPTLGSRDPLPELLLLPTQSPTGS